MSSSGATLAKVAEPAIVLLNHQAEDRIKRLRSLCNRLEEFEGRLEPGPHPAAEEAKNPPSPPGLPGLRVRLEEIDQMLNWLDNICSRLDRLA